MAKRPTRPTPPRVVVTRSAEAVTITIPNAPKFTGIKVDSDEDETDFVLRLYVAPAK